MKINSLVLRSFFLTLLMMGGFSLVVSAETELPDILPDLFAESAEVETRSTGHGSIEVLRSRDVDVDFSILKDLARTGGRPESPGFVLNFFDDARFNAYIHQIEELGNGSIGMVGVVDTPGYNELVMVSRDGALQA